MKEVKVAILGLGNRGKNYGGHLAAQQGVKIVAICDKYQAKIDKVKGSWGVPDDMCFTDEDKFFGLGKAYHQGFARNSHFYIPATFVH